VPKLPCMFLAATGRQKAGKLLLRRNYRSFRPVKRHFTVFSVLHHIAVFSLLLPPLIPVVQGCH